MPPVLRSSHVLRRILSPNTFYEEKREDNTMKRLSYLLLALIPAGLLLGTAAVRAQDLDAEWFGIGPGPGAVERWRGCIEQAMNAAGVTEAQKAQLKAIREKYAPQIRDIWQSDMAPEAKREAIQKLKAEARAEIADVLPAEQRQAIRRWMVENCKRPAPGPGIGPKEGCLKQAIQAVVSDPAKKRQIAAIEQQLRTDLEALRKDTSIPIEQKKARAAQLTREAHQKIQSLLTPQEKAAIREWIAANCKGEGPGAAPPPKRPKAGGV